jgi:hypothetical protein
MAVTREFRNKDRVFNCYICAPRMGTSQQLKLFYSMVLM